MSNPARTRLLDRALVAARRAWPRGVGRGRRTESLTAVSLGAQCRAAQVRPGADGRLRLAAVAVGSEGELPSWAPLFARSQPLLVLGNEQRHLLTIDRPEVPDAELALAVRWPLAEALEAEPDALLTTALALPRINESLRPQVLAVAAQLDTVKRQLATLAQAGVAVRHIDVADTALRGIALLQPPDDDGWVVVALMGGGIAIGLVWQGALCALRALPLAARRGAHDPELDGQVALHVQRTVDHFERQTTTMAIRHVLATLPSWPADACAALRTELPLQARLFALGDALEMDAATRDRCAADDDLSALACVAAARWIDAHPDLRQQFTAAAAARPAAAEAAAVAAAALAAAAAGVVPAATGPATDPASRPLEMLP